MTLHDAVQALRRQMVCEALDAADGNLSAAARALGVSAKTMRRLAARYAGRKPLPLPGRTRKRAQTQPVVTQPMRRRLSAAEIVRRYSG